MNNVGSGHNALVKPYSVCHLVGLPFVVIEPRISLFSLIRALLSLSACSSMTLVSPFIMLLKFSNLTSNHDGSATVFDVFQVCQQPFANFLKVL